MGTLLELGRLPIESEESTHASYIATKKLNAANDTLCRGWAEWKLYFCLWKDQSLWTVPVTDALALLSTTIILKRIVWITHRHTRCGGDSEPGEVMSTWDEDSDARYRRCNEERPIKSNKHVEKQHFTVMEKLQRKLSVGSLVILVSHESPVRDKTVSFFFIPAACKKNYFRLQSQHVQIEMVVSTSRNHQMFKEKLMTAGNIPIVTLKPKSSICLCQ